MTTTAQPATASEQENPSSKIVQAAAAGWLVILVGFVVCLVLARLLIALGYHGAEETIGLIAIALLLVTAIAVAWATSGDYESQYLATLDLKNLLTTKDFLSSIQKHTSGPAFAEAALAFLFLVLARPLVDAFHGSWRPLLFVVALVAGFVGLTQLMRLSRIGSLGVAGGIAAFLIVTGGFLGLAYALEMLLKDSSIGFVGYSVRLIAMLLLGLLAWAGLLLAGSIPHALLPMAQHFNRSRERILRRSSPLTNPLSLLEAFLLASITRYWIISFAFAPLVYAASYFLPAAFIFFTMSFAVMVPIFVGCVRGLARSPSSAYFQLPRFCLPYAVLVVVSVNLAVLSGYAVGYGLKSLLYYAFGRDQNLYLPDIFYSFFDRSPLSLPLAGQAEGAFLALTLVLCLAWVVMVYKKRAFGQLFAVFFIVVALVSKQAFEPVKSILLEFGNKFTITPAIVVALAVPAIAALVFSSIGHALGTQTCGKCNEDELPDYAEYCSNCGNKLEDAAPSSAQASPAGGA
jgi:hypothetical protein